ncbi:MAG: hypothetical protein GYB65_13010 [Chloroflexi bacterium]|nr:hypothetical protein [Chloroflexota bacterium]
MRRLLVVGIIVAILLVVLVPASASTTGQTYFRLDSLPDGSCTPGGLVEASFTYAVRDGDTSTHYWFLYNERTGASTTDVVGSIFGPEGPVSFDPGFSMTIPAGTQAGDQLTMKVIATSERELGTGSTITVNCNDGSVVSTSFYNIGDLGPQLPSGFVQRLITCDTPVYDSPAGTPVGDNAILAGQEWHVNPVAVDGADGQSWTEVFVGGYNNGYIPTSCVAPAVTGYGQ